MQVWYCNYYFSAYGQLHVLLYILELQFEAY